MPPNTEALPTPLAARLAAWAAEVLGRDFLENLAPLAGDAGGRRYFRLAGVKLLAMFGPDAAENQAWLAIGGHLRGLGLPLPQIRAFDLARGFFLLEDLGDVHLAKNPTLKAYRQTVALMADFHQRGASGFQARWCHQEPVYNAAMILEKEILYWLRNFEIDPDLRREAEAFACAASAEAPPSVLIHRDFQSRNVMLAQGGPFLIDWQGARLGPGAYDLASLLNDPYVTVPSAWRDELIALYLDSLGRNDEEKFRRELLFTGAARLMQNLGAYAKLCAEGKDFARWTAPAAERLLQHFNDPPLHGWPRLKACASRILTHTIHGLNFPAE